MDAKTKEEFTGLITDALNDVMIPAMEDMEERLGGRISKVEGRLTNVEDRLTYVEIKVDSLDRKFDAQQNRLDRHDSRIAKLERIHPTTA